MVPFSVKVLCFYVPVIGVTSRILFKENFKMGIQNLNKLNELQSEIVKKL